MMSRAFKPLLLAAALLALGLGTSTSTSTASDRLSQGTDAGSDIQVIATSSGPIEQMPSVPLAPTGTLRLRDIIAHPDIEVVVPPVPGPPDGPTIARHLTERYADTRTDCGADDRPAFLCSGVLFRATIPGPYHTWNPNPSNRKGSVSFSWIRQDAKFRSIFTAWYSNGFIFLPDEDAAEYGYDRMDVVCAYPLDGGTDTRTNLGCGTRPEDAVHSRPCAEQGITTGAAWVALFLRGNTFWYTCSFDVANGTADAAAAFMQMAAAMALIPGRFQPDSNVWNELLIRTWPQNSPTIPIEAFFYQAGTANGLAYAKVDQRDFYQTVNRWVPIIRMTMPATEAEDARFDYLPDEQAVVPMPPTARVRWTSTPSVYETPAQPLVTDGPTVFHIRRGTVLATLNQSVEVSFVVTDSTPTAIERTSLVLPVTVDAADGTLPPPGIAADRSYARISYPGMLSTDQIWVSYEGNGTHDTPFPRKTAAFNAGIPPSWLGAPNQVYYWVKRDTRILVSPVVASHGGP